MLNLLAFFIMGCIFATVGAMFLWMAWAEDYESQIRSWRKEALAAKQNADFWQAQYSKDLAK